MTVEISKLNGYAVQGATSLQISKLVGYAIGVPASSLQISKLVGYAIQGATAQQISKIVAYVVGTTQSPFFPQCNLCLGNLKVETAPSSIPPQVTLRLSDDKGYTWHSLEPQAFGTQGDYNIDLSWRRTGISRDRVIEVSWTDTDAALTGVFVAVNILAT